VSIPNSSGGYDRGASAITNMKIKVLDLKTKKLVFDEGLYHTDVYKNRTAEEAANLSINAFCELFKDLVNYSFPVDLSIGEVETTNKKGLAETVTVKNAEFMYVHIKKGFLDVPSTKFEVSCLNDEGKMEVIGKLEAKQIDGTKVVAELDKGAKEIAKKIQEGKTVTTEINGNTITIGGLFKLGASFAADGSLITSANNFSQIFARQPTSSVSIGLVKIKPGYKTDQVVAQLKAYLKDDVKVLTHQEFIEFENNFWSSNSPIGFIFNLGVSMGFVVGVIIVYQVLSTDVNAHLREYATFKAIGYRHFYLLTIIFEEALILAALGFFPGVAVSLGLYQLTRTATNLPMYMTIVRGLQVLLLTIIMCAISGVIATNKLQSADPADMF
jgi:DevC protein